MASLSTRSAVGAVAAAIVVARARDIKHMPRLILDQDGSITNTVKIWAAAVAIFGYERVVAAILRRAKLTRLPSTLAAMLSLFAILRTTERLHGREAGDRLSKLLGPGVDFLGKWMGLFLAPPLVSLDASIAALPAYPTGVWANLAAILSCGWAGTHAVAAAVATQLAPRANGTQSPCTAGSTSPRTSNEAPNPASTGDAAAVSKEPKKDAQTSKQEVVPATEAIRRAWILTNAASFLGVACSAALPPAMHRPVAKLCELSTSVVSLSLAKDTFPESVKRILHPLVVMAVSSNLACRFVGPSVPFFDAGNGVGDRLFQWLPAAVTGLGVRMYDTTGLWLDDAADFKCVLATCCVSGCASLAITTAAAVAPSFPLSVPAPLSLPLLHRSVMSALGIEGSHAIGPECDPKLAVASILVTGCIGASLGGTLLDACPALFNKASPLVRGVSMGCSAHSIGTAGLISAGDTQAAAISGASMCLAGTVHTAVLQIPGVVPAIRALAGLA
mmetsp:Transcript_40289/g.110909  ORF Transcript_40289/g.110909 Transcript_40289/m.110909 type:complete len:503 (-) Transcript_40289:248-1756(-)